MLAAKKAENIRVLEERGGGTPKIVFEKAGEVAEKPITIVPIEDAPVCETADDLLTFEARLASARLLRAFLDDAGLTAFELLFDYGRLRQILRHETLFPQALQRVGTIQARKTGAKPADRMGILERAVNQVVERAREGKDAERFLAVLDAQGIGAMFAAVGAEFTDPAAAAYTRAAALAKALGRQPDANGKIAFICDLIEKGASGEAFVLLDEIVAEIIDGGQALQELLGSMGDLAAVLRALAQLSAGLCNRSGGRGSALPRLNAVMGKYPLVVTRGILLGRVERSFRGIKMLTRQDGASDRDAFIALVDVLAAPGGFRGGQTMSEAVTARARMTLAGDGEDLTPEAVIAKIQEFLKSRAARLGYLFDLGKTPFGAKYQAAVLKALLRILEEIKDITALLPPGGTSAENQAVIEDLRPRLASGGMPTEIQAQIMRKLEKVLGGAPKPGPGQPAPAIAAPQPPRPPEPPKPEPAAAPPRSDGTDLPRRTFAPGDYLFRQGDAGDEAYIIMSGEIEILVAGNGAPEAILSTIGRGDIVGEMALINQAPRVASARVKSPVQTIVMSGASFQNRLDRLAETDRIMRRLLDLYAERLAAFTVT